VVKNTLPENGPKLLHSVVLLRSEADIDAFGRAVLSAAPEQDYIPSIFRDKVLAHTALVGPGRTGEIQMSAPSKPGIYPVVCSYPGHRIVGMTAKLVVR
jgi:azurin